MKPGEPIKFTSGINQKPDPELGGFQTLTNVDLSEIGVAKAIKVNEEAVSYGASVHSLGFEGVGIANVLFAGVGTTLYRGSTSLKADWSGENMTFSAQGGRAYVMTPTAGLWYYSGGTMYRAGAPAPSTTLTATDNAAGSFSGTYTLVTTFVNRNGFEGNPSGTSSVSPSSEKLDLTSIPTNSNADYDITARKIYIKGGSSPVYSEYVLLLTISDNTTTSYSGLDTTNVDTLTILSEDNDTPSGGKMIVNHYDTGFMIGVTDQENELLYAKVGGLEQWPTAQSLVISRTGDPLKSIVSWDSSLWVFSVQKVYQIIGSPGAGTLSTNFFRKETRATKGTISPRSVVATPMGIYYEAEDDIYLFDGSAGDNVGHALRNIVNARTKAGNSVGVYWDNKMLMSLATDGSSTPNVTIVYDFELKDWTTYDRGYLDFAVDRTNNILYGATTSGVERFQTGASYDDWTIKTKDLVAGVDTYAAFGKYQVEMVGSCTANIYIDGTLSQTSSLSATTKKFLPLRFPQQIGNRAAIELVGAASSTQAKIYSIGHSLEDTRGQV